MVRDRFSLPSLSLCAMDNLDTSVDTDFSGSTAVVSVVRGNVVTTANIGDSRITAAVVDASTGALTGVALSIDHKPDR